MPFPTTRSLAFFALRFALIYGALLAGGLGLGLFDLSESVVVGIAGRQLAVIEEPEIERRLVLAEGGDLVQYVSTSRVRNLEIASREAGYVSQNLFLFAALVLASPGLAWRRRGIALGAGTLAIVALDVLVVMSMVWKGDRIYLSELHPGISSGPFAHFAHLVGALHPTGGVFMVPVFLWGFTLLALPLFDRADAMARRDAARNDPCPCGSGRKFKRCCGA